MGKHYIIAREGWLPIATTVVLGAVVQNFLGLYWALPLWFCALALLYLYRDPNRVVPSLPLAIVSPLDGIVRQIREVEDAYLHRQAICISIDLNLTGVHATRSPIEGKIVDRWTSSLATGDNQDEAAERVRHGIWIQTDENDDVVLMVNGGSVWNRPRCYVNYGERIGQGQRCGYVGFGATLDVLVPANVRLQVKLGDKISAGSDIIGTFVHK